MSTLRSRTIRLAQAHPELRADLRRVLASSRTGSKTPVTDAVKSLCEAFEELRDALSEKDTNGLLVTIEGIAEDASDVRSMLGEALDDGEKNPSAKDWASARALFKQKVSAL